MRALSVRRVRVGAQVTWKESLSNNAAWDTLTWFAALIGMASYLNKYGFIAWFSNQVRTAPNFQTLHAHPPRSRCPAKALSRPVYCGAGQACLTCGRTRTFAMRSTQAMQR